jgi:oligopeptide transport system substrate-binding protein
VVNWTELNQAIHGHTAPAFVITWIGDLPDPDTFLFTLLDSEGTYNMVNFRNAAVDSVISRGRSERSMEIRLGYYRDAERLALIEAPIIPLFNMMTAMLPTGGAGGGDVPLRHMQRSAPQVWLTEQPG